MKKSDKPNESQKAIDESLKKVYQETLDEDIPDRFMSLLQRLRDAGPNASLNAGAAASQTSKQEEVR